MDRLSRRETSAWSINAMLFVACLSTFSGSNVFAGPIFPPETIYDGPKPVPPLPRPGYRQSVIDPTFGTKITRISGDEMNPSKPSRLQHHYSKDQAWNCDMTLIKLHLAEFILDAKTYQVVNKQSSKNEPKWSTVDPDIIFYVRGNQFRKWNVRTNADTLLHAFPEGDISIGNWEGNISIGDRYVLLNVGTLVIGYDIKNDVVIAQKDLGGPRDWVSMSQSGNYIVATGEPSLPGRYVYDLNLNLLRKIFNKGEHGDLGYDAAGNEVYAQMCPMRMARLDNGVVTDLVKNPSPFWFCGHLGTRNNLRPGWALVTTNSGDREIFAVKLDNSNIVQRFAHTRTTEATYDSQAKGVISPDGSKVMWNSDWGGGTVYAYVAEMPGNSGPPEATSPLAPTNLRILP